MKNIYRATILLLLLTLSLSSSLIATDLKFNTLITVDYWENENEDSVEVIIENDNVLTAVGYSVSFEIKDWNNNIVFEDTVEPEPILPFTTLSVKSNLTWTPELTGQYTLTSSIDFIDDIDTSNNTASGEFPVIWGLDIGISKFQEWSLKLCYEPDESWGFMPQKPYPAGTTFESYDDTEFNLVTDGWKYYGYLDCNKSARYGHVGYAFTMDAFDSSQVDTFKVNYWTKINGEDYMAGFTSRIDTADAVVGSEPQLETTDNSNTISSQTTPEPKDSVCAILVSGKGNDASEQAAFDFDVELMKNNLMLESLGPKLSADNIVVLNNPTKTELYNAIFALTNNYRKLTFYYSGHGWGAGIITKDTNFLMTPSYLDLSERMAATGIDELEMIIDACHAGSAIKYYDTFRWREKDVTLIAACAEDTVSYTRRLFVTAGGDTIRVGAYSWFLMKCFGDPAADRDGINGVTWKEAYEWVRSRNETFGSRNINRDLMPQLYVHKAEPPRQPVNIPPDTDLEFSSDQPDTNATYYFEMRTDFKDFSTLDTTIADISKYRYWSYSSTLLEGSYTYNLKFKYNTQLDSFTTDGDPGILFRDSAGVEWEAYNNYTWSAESSYVQGLDIDKYGDFALGTIKIVVDVNDDENLIVDNYDLSQNYPNPFNPSTTINFSLPEAGIVTIKIFDLLGKEITTLINDDFAAGRYDVKFDAATINRQISSGIYFYQINVQPNNDTGNDFMETKKMLLLK
ncbi:MAG: T9SS type A sorting domain-containing protein [Ignavibacteriae bacterium]|nr:T9SS C-terminal target domain-containing protein [Ignavibacteriota bacterium]NOH00025.1 T9SS type A sorting domain-containing protein [Ignavibacteriota bacterium]